MSFYVVIWAASSSSLLMKCLVATNILNTKTITVIDCVGNNTSFWLHFPCCCCSWRSSTGNVFVIAAIILERNLQNVANYLVASLAVADLFVACLVMPLGAVYEVSKKLHRKKTAANEREQ